MVLSKSIRDYCINKVHSDYFVAFEGKQLALPSRFLPDKTLLAKHRTKIVV
jgi:hypothetical protein